MFTLEFETKSGISWEGSIRTVKDVRGMSILGVYIILLASESRVTKEQVGVVGVTDNQEPAANVITVS